MTWIRTASLNATAARARRDESTGAKSSAATGDADRVAPFLAAAEALAADVAVVVGDLGGWQVRVHRVQRGRRARGRHCDLAWAHPGWAVRRHPVDFPVAPTCS